MNLISFIIIGIIMLVLGNTMIMAARERMREYAVLKTIGFSGWHLVGLIAGESLAISLMGGAIGLAATFPLAEGFAAALPKGWFPVFNVEPSRSSWLAPRPCWWASLLPSSRSRGRSAPALWKRSARQDNSNNPRLQNP